MTTINISAEKLLGSIQASTIVTLKAQSRIIAKLENLKEADVFHEYLDYYDRILKEAEISTTGIFDTLRRSP